MGLFEQLGLSEIEDKDSRIKISNKTWPLVVIEAKEEKELSLAETAKKLEDDA